MSCDTCCCGVEATFFMPDLSSLEIFSFLELLHDYLVLTNCADGPA